MKAVGHAGFTSDSALVQELFLSPFRRSGSCWSMSSAAIFFQVLNSGLQPGSSRLFGLLLVAVPVEDSSSRDVLNECGEGESFRRGVRAACISTQSPHGPGFSLDVVHASEVFENILRPQGVFGERP
jgi:hypothetical protein